MGCQIAPLCPTLPHHHHTCGAVHRTRELSTTFTPWLWITGGHCGEKEDTPITNRTFGGENGALARFSWGDLGLSITCKPANQSARSGTIGCFAPHSANQRSGYVVAGRSLTTVEARESDLDVEVGVGLVATLILTYLAYLAVVLAAWLTPTAG